MSLFGKNIRKIRSVRSLSQQAFAELFDLKRGTLGAYEEGRSEPKIETIIKIANYFSIPIDDLLTNELTVNELLKFRGKPEHDDLKAKPDICKKVPCITREGQQDYIQHHAKDNFIADLPEIHLPIYNEADLRAFVIHDLEMSTDSDGFYPKDVVIGVKVQKKEYPNLASACLFLVVSEEKVFLRRIYQSAKKFILKADHKGIEDIEIPYADVKELWEIKYAFYHRIPDSRNTDIKQQMSFLEEEFHKLRTSLNN
ncbi:DNA-binding XRE family transcriptional regulator [Gramella sp. Hel_I_59]|uniref:helix-turn-helix domain-containing protein n=1 Tax=Gramella sp. Hel_I_59 TaxID=1249978 RepID=UPI00115295DC|nr:helix-turn-helix transcriptional regulator [Gramella sp. Hel_I_59]TQI69987.1 DNA-binding XRE family transcriptional regulator [Gramella sp. Hel_I_59]